MQPRKLKRVYERESPPSTTGKLVLPCNFERSKFIDEVKPVAEPNKARH